MANGTTLLVVGFFVVAVRFLLAGADPAPAPFFWYNDYYDSSSSSEEDSGKTVYVYVNVSSPGSIAINAGAAPTADTSPTAPLAVVPGTFTIPLTLQLTTGAVGAAPAAQPVVPAAPAPAAAVPAAAAPAAPVAAAPAPAAADPAAMPAAAPPAAAAAMT